MTGVTQMFSARQGTITPQMRRVAEREGLPAELIRDEIARGRLIIPANVHHLAQRLDPMAIGAVARVMIDHQARQGVDYVTVHCGILREHVPLALGRVTGIVSRGGSLLAYWMTHHKRQNPLYTHFDRILEIARTYDVTLSLGDGLRPGSLA